LSAPASAPSTFQATAAGAYSAATRVAGAIIALGYLSGLVAGPVVVVVGGLALMTLGRSLLQPRLGAAVTGGALAVLAAALGVAALRWQALDLDKLRGVQAVLGPTLTVGPVQAAIGTGLAAAAALMALVAWVSRPWPSSLGLLVWSGVEVGIGCLALVTVFFLPSPGFGDGFGDLLVGIGRWLGSVALVGSVALGFAWYLERWDEHVRGLLVALAGTAVAAAAAMVVAIF
jgi:hypothetical protein